MGDTRESSNAIVLRRAQVDEMFAQARASSLDECCGMVGGRAGRAESLYPLRNVAADSRVRYEAALDDLLAAPKLMRERNEQLLAIYHSHPQEPDPLPSETDVRLAYYPDAVYFIIGFDDAGAGVLRAFRIYEREGRWEPVEYRVDEG